MLLDPILDLLIPHRCVTCRVRCDEPPWCDPCAREAAALEMDPAGACATCAGAGDGHACWQGGVPVAGMVAAYRYGGPVADAVVAGKVLGAHAVWAALGRRLAERCRRVDVDIVTWVPAPADRRRQRGFDHAELLARSVGAVLDRPAARLLTVPRRLPDRGRIDAAHRPSPLPGSYRGPRWIRGAVLLVDDVVTTGGTVTQAASALSDAGAVVRAAVLARAGAHPLEGVRVPGRPGGSDTFERS